MIGLHHFFRLKGFWPININKVLPEEHTVLFVFEIGTITFVKVMLFWNMILI